MVDQISTITSENLSVLQNLPLSSLIGDPMNAAIAAQGNAARTTMDFISEMGFEKEIDGINEKKKLRTVTFSYVKQGSDGVERNFELTVPVLTLLPIPFIRINNMNISFKCNITGSVRKSEETSQSETEEDTESHEWGVSGGGGFWGWSFNAHYGGEMSGSVSTKKDSKSTQNSEFSIESTIDITVNAGSADMPGGMSKMLSIFNDLVKEEANQNYEKVA
jgi:hypothetical protein